MKWPTVGMNAMQAGFRGTTRLLASLAYIAQFTLRPDTAVFVASEPAEPVQSETVVMPVMMSWYPRVNWILSVEKASPLAKTVRVIARGLMLPVVKGFGVNVKEYVDVVVQAQAVLPAAHEHAPSPITDAEAA